MVDFSLFFSLLFLLSVRHRLMHVCLSVSQVKGRRDLRRIAKEYPVQWGTTCATCRAMSTTHLRCAKCHDEWYCNKDCQRQHWPIHRRTCGQLSPPPPSTAAGSCFLLSHSLFFNFCFTHRSGVCRRRRLTQAVELLQSITGRMTSSR